MFKNVIRVLAVAHLLFLLLSLVHVVERLDRTKVSYLTALINDLYFGDWSFGFFSRQVGNSLVATYDLHFADSSKATLKTEQGFKYYASNLETFNRFYGLSVYMTRDTTYQDLCTRSVAVRLLNVNPQAYKVDLRLDGIYNVRMDEKRAGKKPRYTFLYSTDFSIE